MELGEHGLSRKDRIEAGDDHPLRATLDRLAAVLGIECDLYEHTGRGALVTIGLTDPTSLVVSARLGALPPAQQVFLLGRALLAIALDLQATLLFSGRDLRALLDATTALIVPGFGGGDARLDDLVTRLKKHLPRRARKDLESLAPAYAAAPLGNVDAWQRAIVRSLTRATALWAGDLVAVVAALPFVADAGRPTPASGPPPEDIADLLRFWMSDAALDLRTRTGQL